MKRLASLLLILSGFGSYAQTIDNLNLLNTSGLHGTPRYQAMGGAFTALGNDFSSIHLNPAGASVFRSDQFGLSLGFQGQTDRTRFLENSNESSNFNLLFENIGLVKKFGSSTPVTFGISYNKMADFNSDFGIGGINRFQPGNNTNLGYTLGEYWLSGVQDMTISEMEMNGFIEEASATDATVLLTDSIGAFIYDYYPDDESNVDYQFSEGGSHSEAVFTLGSQIEDRFFFGFGVGVPNLSYRSSSALTESGFADTSYITSYTLNRSNNVYASGVNIKLGIIAKPTQWLRLGLSYQSPSWYRVSETYTTSVDASAFNGERYLGTEYIFDDIRYSVTTPAIVRAGAALVLAKSAIISIDYERNDPGNLSLRSRDGANYQADEAAYQQVTKVSNTIKAGFEYRIGPTFARLGYQMRQSNFMNPDQFISDRNMYSLGFGYASRDWSIDLSYVATSFTSNYVVHPYLGDRLDGQGVTERSRTMANDHITKGNVVIGASFKF